MNGDESFDNTRCNEHCDNMDCNEHHDNGDEMEGLYMGS